MKSWKDYIDGGYIPSTLFEEKPIIALYGLFQTGKSTLINCLFNHYVALTGKGMATTSLTARYRYNENEKLQYRRTNGELKDITLAELNEMTFRDDICSNGSFHLEARIASSILQYCDIVDTPGFDANVSDTKVALSILENVHYCLFVIPNRELLMQEKNLLTELNSKGVSISVIMNCSLGRSKPKWLPSNKVNQEILKQNKSWFLSVGIKLLPLNGEEIFPCNALFYWSQQKEFPKSIPFIDAPEYVMEDINHVLHNYESDSAQIIAQSRIPSLIDGLKAQIKTYDPVTHKWGEHI